jgi:hypothetical protein
VLEPRIVASLDVAMETSQERDDLLAIVADQRRNFLCTLDGVTDKEAVVRTTVSELTLGGLVKHLGRTQRSWLAVIAGTAPAEFAMSDLDPDPYRMTESESLAELIDAFHAAAAEFDRAVRGEHDLDRRVTLPRYPWSPPRPVVWTIRHILAAHLPGDRAPQRSRRHHPRGPGRRQHHGIHGRGRGQGFLTA